MFKYNLFDLEHCDNEKLSEMYSLCFGTKASTSYFKWKYYDNPAGKLIAFDATHNSDMAGFYGIIPEHYLINGKKTLVYQSMDTMTHPGYQKKGLFTTLAKKTYQKLKEQSPESLIIGIPGNNSYHGFVNKLNWKLLHTFSYVFLQRHIFKALELFAEKPDLSVKKIEPLVEPQLDSFLDKYTKKGTKIKPFIDRKFLDWRINQHPFRKYTSVAVYQNEEMLGIGIYYIIGNKCFIEWVESSEEQNEKKVLMAFCSYIFKEHTVGFIYTWAPIKKTFSKKFRSLGFLINPYSKGPFSYKVPFIIRTDVTKINDVNLLDVANYDLQPIIQD